MNAEQLLRERRLDEALDALQQEIRQSPAEAGLRVFLFQLLCVLGQWDRAVRQLAVISDLDKSAMLMVNACREVIPCERLREDVFAGVRMPLIFGEPADWIGAMVQACQLEAQGHGNAAADMRAEALDAAPAVSGMIDDQPFAWIADGDARLGPLFEAMIEGRYYWVPADAIALIEFDPATDLRDMVWLPARFTWTNQGQAYGFMPACYPGSYAVDDAAVRMARATEWSEIGEGAYHGLGQRQFMTDAGFTRMLDCTRIQFDAEPETKGGEGDG